MGFPHSSVGKESACSAGDPGLIPGLGRSTGEGNGNPLQYSCLENPMDRGAWQAIVHGVTRVRHGLVTKAPRAHTFLIKVRWDLHHRNTWKVKFTVQKRNGCVYRYFFFFLSKV